MSKVLDSKKTAIVLFNLGGPDSLKAVKPFLFNLFNEFCNFLIMIEIDKILN